MFIKRFKRIKIIDLLAFYFLIDSMIILWTDNERDNVNKDLMFIAFLICCFATFYQLYVNKTRMIYVINKIYATLPILLAVLVKNNLILNSSEIFDFVIILYFNIWIVLLYSMVFTALYDWQIIDRPTKIILFLLFWHIIVSSFIYTKSYDYMWFGGVDIWVRTVAYFNILYTLFFVCREYSNQMNVDEIIFCPKICVKANSYGDFLSETKEFAVSQGWEYELINEITDNELKNNLENIQNIVIYKKCKDKI